jgi:hypothetical protein
MDQQRPPPSIPRVYDTFMTDLLQLHPTLRRIAAALEKRVPRIV